MKKENINIDDILYDSLENFEVVPSQELKKRIMKDMFFVNIVRYHLVKLIGGLTGIVAISVISVISVYLYNVSDQPANANIKKTLTINTSVNSEQSSLYLSQNKSVTTGKINSDVKSNSDNVTFQNKQTENKTENQSGVQSNNTTANYPDNIITDKNEEINLNIRQQINTNSKTKNDLTVQSNNSDKNQFPDPINNQPDKLNSNNDNDLGLSDNPALNSNNSGNSFLEKINHLNMKFSVLPYDLSAKEVFNDTLFNFKGEQVILKSKFFAVDAFWSGFMHQSIFSDSNPETQNFSLQRNDAVEPINGYECFGINFSMNKKHILFQAGISITKINDEFKYATLLLNPRQKFFLTQNNNPFNYIDNGNYFLIDTPGGYWHYTYVSDSIIHVSDSVWENIIDTSLVNIYDSTLKTVYDTLKNKKLRNTYSYFEIPVMAGYEVSYSNFDFALKAGIITSFLIGTSGNNTTYNTGELSSIGSYIPFRKVLFSGIVSVSANYKITDHWGIYVEPYYRRSLTGVLRNNNILNQHVSVYGARFGVKYKF